MNNVSPSLVEFLDGLTRTGHEHHGPCWRCGGKDRFVVFKDGRGWCRQCRWRGDTIQLLRDRDGLSFQAAKRALGLDLSPVSLAIRQRTQALTAADTHMLDAYKAWQREKLIVLTDTYRELCDERESAQSAGRAIVRCSDLYTEEDHAYWGEQLALLSASCEEVANDLDILTYDAHEAVRFAWWREEANGCDV